MTVQHLPPRPLPPGERYYADVTREIEASEGIRSTGWHFREEPTAERISEIARIHEGCDPSHLSARFIDTGNARHSGWTVFWMAPLP